MITRCGTTYSSTFCLSKENEVFIIGGIDKNKIPKKILATASVDKLSCGSNFVIFLDSEGKLWSYGSNYCGQLGIVGSRTDVTLEPEPIVNIPPMIDIYCGTSHTLCITDNNEIWSFGENKYNQCLHANVYNGPQKTEYTAQRIAAGESFSIFQDLDGIFYGCGDNRVGQIGIGNIESTDIPVKIDNIHGTMVDICCGISHTLFLNDSGNVYATGCNDNGRLGLGDTKHRNTVTALFLSGISFISCGAWHSMCVDDEGHCWTFGNNYYGTLGNGSQVSSLQPQKILPEHEIRCLSRGFGWHTFIKDSQDSILVFGRNNSCQLGLDNGKDEKAMVLAPTELASEYSHILANTNNTAKSARK